MHHQFSIKTSCFVWMPCSKLIMAHTSGRSDFGFFFFFLSFFLSIFSSLFKFANHITVEHLFAWQHVWILYNNASFHTLIHTSFPKASVHILNQITSMISFICLAHSQVQCSHSFMHCGVCRCMCMCMPMCVCVRMSVYVHVYAEASSPGSVIMFCYQQSVVWISIDQITKQIL